MWDQAIQFVQDQLQNQIIAGGAALGIMSSILYSLKRVPSRLYALLKRHLITEIGIEEGSQIFNYVQEYLFDHELIRGNRLIAELGCVLKDNLELEAKMVYKIGPGSFLVRDKWHWFLLHYVRSKREAAVASGIVANPTYIEDISLVGFSKTKLQSFIEKAHKAKRNDTNSSVFIGSWIAGGWQFDNIKHPRGLDSVILEDDVKAGIIKDLDAFYNITERQWYFSMGIPYQRGFLLHGEPGNGKTSLITALAAKYGRRVYMLNLQSMDDDAVQACMRAMTGGAFVVIEDADCMNDAGTRHADKDRVSLSTLLNCLDGLGSATGGRVLFLTTNKPEKLDAALIRPGRVDRRFELKHATPQTARDLYLRFFPEQEHLAGSLGHQVQQQAYSMANLQEHFLQHRYDPQRAAQLPKVACKQSHLQALLGE